MGAAYRVLQGFQGNAGQPGLLARELRKLGVKSDSVLIGRNRFNYPCDFWVEKHDRAEVRKFLTREALKYDVIHVHAITPFFTKRGLAFPMGTDLLALKAAGKRIIMHFRGSEVRLPSVFAERSPYHYVEDDPNNLISRFPEESQIDYIAMCRALADKVVVSDPELRSYVPGAQILPRAMDLAKWSRVSSSNPRPLVVHAPSRQGVKGTRHVIAAVEALKAEGLDFDFRLIEGLPHDEAMALYQQSDIIVDQLRIGWYGVLATEGMALGKTVVAYIRDDILPTLGDKPPLANANPDNIQDVLRELILNKPLREEIADQGYRYCRRVHDSRTVAKKAMKIYEATLARPHHFDFDAYMAINQKQENAMFTALVSAKKAGAQKKRRSLGARAILHLRTRGVRSLVSTVISKFSPSQNPNTVHKEMD